MKKNLVTKMFEETFSTHFRNATWKTDNSHFGFVLDYLLETIKLINTQEELTIFECEWQRIETRVDGLFVSHQNNLLPKIEKINNRIAFLKKYPNKRASQKGFRAFYETEYKKLFQESLELKKIDELSKIFSKPKRSKEWNKFRIRIYFSIV